MAILLANLGSSLSVDELDEGARVMEDSELIYYLNVSYDGKDKGAIVSSENATADVRSDYIYVEDKIPDGLIFEDFVKTDDGTIGAVQRSNPDKTCSGHVVDGTTGLHYDDKTNTVSFKIKNLQAGCQITVGIKTKTPKLNGKPRLDFYNTAFGRENDFSIGSNTVHVFLGNENQQLYKVKYQYTGTDIPKNAPTLPADSEYAAGVSVGVIADVDVAGYTFSGWQATTESGVTITDGKFTMPSKDVTIVGSFTKNQTHSVTYIIEGSDKPSGYQPPKQKNYEVGEDVLLDSLKKGDEIDGYRFKGWTVKTPQVQVETVDEGQAFTMPGQNVEIVGSFELIQYKVTYQFQGSVKPPDADSLLPEEKSYVPGATVTTAKDPVSTGYRFLGWYKASTFIMPSEDVVIYGEWMKEAGTFQPTITKKIDGDNKKYYHDGDVVTFTITVTNPSNLTLTNVMIQEQMPGTKFINGNGSYTVLNDTMVEIPTMAPSQAIDVKAQYTVGKEPVAHFTNQVELTGALASNDYHLDTSKTYQATVEFDVSNLSLDVHPKGEEMEDLKGVTFDLCEDATCSSVLQNGLSFKDLEPGKTYYLKQKRAATGHTLVKESIQVTVDENGHFTVDGYDSKQDGGHAEFDVINPKINILPETGGMGLIPFLVGGLVLMIGSASG